MPTEAANFTEQDAQAVGAVRKGDADRYRELVERHERRVYAVAWSRLGDASLAEEVTQEAFIRAYRRLWLLGDGAKFAGWIASIARHVAINFGLRHRRELNKRERWALEQAQTSDAAVEETEPPCTPETLRQTLAELPDAHRECLVLFYLEGNSGAEAATALGISEAALRVRLHRARAALRERLEERLGDSLRKLGPGKTLVPAIMAGVLASSSAKAATAGGAGATIVGALFKSSPLKFAFSLVSFLAFLPGVLLSWLMFRMELRNFRDQRGFRARLFRDLFSQQVFWMALLFIAMLPLVLWLAKYWSFQQFYLLLASLTMIPGAIYVRRLVIIRNRYFVALTAGAGIMLLGCVLMGVGVLPTSLVFPFVFGQAILTTFYASERPIRMDYNLFLRATEGLLETPDAQPDPTEVLRMNKADLLGFARLLGSRWLANDYHWCKEGLRLRLTAVKWSFIGGPLGDFAGWKRASRLLLQWDGTVTATLGDSDHRALRKLRGDTRSAPSELEEPVASAVANAWQCFRAGDSDRAETALGQAPEQGVYVTSPAKAGVSRFRVLMLVLFGVLAVALPLHLLPIPALKGLKPVQLTESEVRAFLSLVTTNPNPVIKGRQKPHAGDPTAALFNCRVLPPTNLFTSESLRAARVEILRSGGYDQNSPRLSSFENAWVLTTAFVGGWLDWESLGIQPADVASHLRGRADREPLFRFIVSPRDCMVEGEQYSVMRLHDSALNQLRWLRGINGLDLVDREPLIQQIVAAQVLSGTVPPGQPPIRDWRQLRGLFHTPGSPTLQDTHLAVAALEILGGLDRMDREACIKRILKLHRGKGYFTPPDTHNRWKVGIKGNARDTLAAFETLRILGALDRVKDLEKWQFRVRKPSKPAPAQWIPWDQVEAWVCQQRLERFLRERSEHPQTPARSLLVP